MDRDKQATSKTHTHVACQNQKCAKCGKVTFSQ